MGVAALKLQYNCSAAWKMGSSAATGAVFEVTGPTETYNPPDLASFQTLSGLPLQNVTQFGGSQATLGCANWACLEPMLDVEMFLGMAPGANFTYWTTPLLGMPANNAVLQWLIDLSNDTDPPLLHSISWGPPESHLSASLAARMDSELAKLCLRGLTFVASSGDDGVNDRTARADPSLCGLSPQYPASSPWVTAVGGTFGPEYGIPERTCQTDVPGYAASITSGGGFSVLWPQHGYQASFVAAYLAAMGPTLPPASAFNATNRAYPDVALQANNIDMVANQYWVPGGGTSASAPIFAGMMALVLSSRLEQGLPPFGLLNPALYQIALSRPSAFSDITVGDNHCTGLQNSNYTCCPYGFTATKSWDPVTGLGAINFGELADALLSLAQH